ncbi:hypothetical protein AXF42_Ash012553 [Apostasia shenzhenica]|uniref:Ras-GAP domain-containing protein n=1 Tax=Apostasia shenzhenica TaxID=1088818 RepID=A0A2I0AR43_9ASPA|nr:hypothetical protein AXF42_Ash012553 [Apostasia shenzhenica]
MQSYSQSQALFLESWLRSSASTSGSSPPAGSAGTAISARSILQAWAELRDPSIFSSEPDRILAALQTLDAARSSLHIADTQAKLLLSLLSTSASLPGSLPLLLRLLYFWLRKSLRASSSLLNTATAVLLRVLSPPSWSPSLAVLVLGALAANPALEDSPRRDCLDVLCRILESEPVEEEQIVEVLAGIGYAFSRSDEPYFSRIFLFFLRIWSRGIPRPSVSSGLMILHLLEWLVTGLVNSRSWTKIEAICAELSVESCQVKCYATFAVAMASAGVLRALRAVPATSRIKLGPQTRNSLEDSISSVSKLAVSNLDGSPENGLLLQCISLGLARSGLVSFSAPVLLALCVALLNEIFPLGKFCKMAVESSNGNSVKSVLEKVKGHLDSVIFKEAGAITSVFCSQYASANDEHKLIVENSLWDYSSEFYSNLRDSALVLRRKHDQLLRDLEKVAKAAFLMVVVFAAEVTKQKLNPKSSFGIQSLVSVRILIAFSCIEYMRHVRLPEYTDAVRRAVLTMQENSALCISFVESIPPYTELTNKRGYVWIDDEVQTARLLFVLRVIPTCISFIPASVFGKLVAPTMFLYLQHPNEKVSRASHSVFVAFTSSGKDSDCDERMELKVKLVFYYTERALEAYPSITSFEGLASGVAALVKHLPTGSPAIFYCINSLVAKATELCKEALAEDSDLWKTWEGSSEPCNKVLDLLMRLIYIVDIQVLPYLLKQLAEFILKLPKDGQKVMLSELYVQVAESDDVTRKPVLVSWLQSLSFLCSGKMTSKSYSEKEMGSESSNGLRLNNTSGQILLSML